MDDTYLCRAPYDNIFTDDGITLRARAAQLPPLTEEEGQMLALPRRRASGSRNRGISGVLGGIADGSVQPLLMV